MLAVAYVGSFSAVLCMLMTSCCCRPQLLAFSMLDICYKFGVENDIIFNQKKSVCIRIGPCDVPRLDVLSTASLCPAFLLWTYVTCLLWL